MCVACHPVMPSIVAAGTFNGEVGTAWEQQLSCSLAYCVRSASDDCSYGCGWQQVVVWDMNNTDEPLVARSRIDDYFHREPIARVRRGVLGGAARARLCYLCRLTVPPALACYRLSG